MGTATPLQCSRKKADNIILAFPANTSHAAVLAARLSICTELDIPESAIVSIDTPWTKLMVSCVPAQPDLRAPVYSEADLLSSFLLNPTLHNITLTQQPRSSDKTQNSAASLRFFGLFELIFNSVLLVFGSFAALKQQMSSSLPPDVGSKTLTISKDSDQGISQSLLKTPLFMFGTPVTVKKWRHIPPVAP
ncbi:hypothetical protein BDV93DRAFT_516193 [Ceratobasidium sp. AG-I]|nr:hypothetical protein BDV93DRAFT_516193 [Ceratobasidium sp. AG-I]